MADFGLVTFEEIKIKRKNESSKIKSLALKLFGNIIGLLFNAGFFKGRFGTKLYFSFLKNDLKNGLSNYELFESLKVWIIKLPFTAGTLFRFNINYVMEYLERLCMEKGIQYCFMPGAVRDKIPGSIFRSRQSSGKVLLKALLVPVLEEIYSKAGKRIDNLDMVIVAGNDNEELFSAVRQLEPYISFVTIVAAEKTEIESRLSELFLDSGLSFSISSEYKNQLRHADLIINLAKPVDISRYRMSKKSLLINLYDSVESGMPGENTVLNDIVYEIAGTDIKNLMYELHGY